MQRVGRRFGTAIALLLTLWLIWQKIHIVVWVHLPWWGFLLMAVLLFLAIDYVIDSVFQRKS